MKRKAFTLIELLVVIAIIAILAAILFPVFAQAKAAAKSSADLSNLKQGSISLLMYSGDSDDVFPLASQVDPDFSNWAGVIQPYVKSLSVFKSPFDSVQLRQSKACNDWGLNCTNGKDIGIAISYAANGYMRHGWDGNNPDLLRGPMATYYCGWMGLKNITMSQTAVTNVAGTILLADRFSSTMQANTGDGGEDYTGNASGRLFGSAFIWTGTDRDYNAAVPDGQVVVNSGTSGAALAGPAGGVSKTNGNKANFAFTDGHAKSMDPIATDPDEAKQPEKNLWDAKR